MTTWFTSDLHFGHKNIIKYCNRPFASVREMDEALVANWNAVVKPDDTVWNLGDVAFTCSPAHAAACLEKLNGVHHLVQGNHDETVLRLHKREWGAEKSPFDSWTEGYKTVTVEGQEIVLCHYAMREWHHAMRGVWHLFGHTHAGLRPFGKSVDVGVDNTREILKDSQAVDILVEHKAQYMRPISFAEVKAFMDQHPIGPHPAFAGGFTADRAVKTVTKEETECR